MFTDNFLCTIRIFYNYCGAALLAANKIS